MAIAETPTWTTSYSQKTEQTSCWIFVILHVKHERKICEYSLRPAGHDPSTKLVVDSEQPGIPQEPHTRKGQLFHPTPIAEVPISIQ